MNGGWVPPIPTEFQEQCHLIQLCEAHQHRYPQLRKIYAVPNGDLRPAKTVVDRHGNAKRISVVGQKLKLQGVKPGVPDLVLPVARGGFFGLYIEMKRTKGGIESDEQKLWRAWLQEEGYRVVVCKGSDVAWKELQQYLELPPTKILQSVP